MPKIKFAKKDVDKGYGIILHAGCVVYTGLDDTYIIPEESLGKLRIEKIDFTILPINHDGASA
jgi:hypothetical protein